MYPIGSPYDFSAPLTVAALVAPANFNPDLEELNLFKAYSDYTDVDKKSAYLVSPLVASTILSLISGRTYAYSENGNSYITIASGTINWTAGSTKRLIIMTDNSNTIQILIPEGVIWAYMGKCTVSSISSASANRLKYIHYNETIFQTIPSIAFQNHIYLTGDLIIPSGVTSIGSNAFRSNFLLASISIPSSVTSIGDLAFYNSRPSSITVSGGTSYYTSENILYNYSQTIAMFCPPASTGNINLPSTLTSIKDSCFYGCGLRTGTVNIPVGITQIPDQCFTSCNNITAITLSTGLTRIGDESFFFCTGLTTITIPSGVTYIGASAFKSSGLTSIIIPSNVITIGGSAFQSCSGLSSVIIPSSVTAIGGQAFYQCSNIASVAVSGGTSYIVIENILYNYAQTITLFCAPKSTGTINLPSTLQYIQNFAFANCSLRTGMVIIPSGCITETGTFQNCTGLTGLAILNSNYTDNGNSWNGCSNIEDFNLPSGYACLAWASNKFTNYTFSTKLTAYSLNQSIINIISQTIIITIGATNKARLLASYPNAVTDANARGITIN